ncbi:Endonuclease IV [hydrothermal vent metagenome]|uniref:Endonuclease IV n=1 Tax=hydrothermal vent metagenome TaxID=652676 RepID=A0A3B1DNJ3_9ZZZZ
MRRLGVHTSIANGIHLSLKRAKALCCSTVQIFSHNPRIWATKKICNEEIESFRELKRVLDIRPVFIHSSYLINLASPDEEIRKKSINLLTHEIRTAHLLRADYIVLHPGKAVGRDIKEAIDRASKALSQAYENADGGVGILLENTAGQKGDISSTIPLISEIIENTPPGCVQGLCLDTCHAYAAGYDITKMEGLEKLKGEIIKYISPLKVELIHLNDSKKGFASGVDRHEHIGEGSIGLPGLKQFLSFPFFNAVPLILETPKKSDDDDWKNLDRVRKMLGLKTGCQPKVDEIQIPT